MFWQVLNQILDVLFTCAHTRAPVVEGKTYCPDCGKGVIFRWTLLSCAGCGQKRQARYAMRQVVPAQRCCTHCGHTEINTRYLQDPEFFQLHYALLSVEEADQSEFWWYPVSAALSQWADTVKTVETSWPAYPCLPAHQPS